MKKWFPVILTVIIIFCAAFSILTVQAGAPIDEIKTYGIDVDLNEDGTVNLFYHIDWLVLDSDEEGPLEWVKIGIPNSHMLSAKAESSNISDIGYYSSGGSYVRIDLDKKYYEGETVSFDFSIVQDYMYQVNYLTEGETVYEFTPGWFDTIKVDKMIVKWNSDKAISFTPA